MATRLFLKDTQTEPGTSGTVRDLGTAFGVGGSHGLSTTERRRYQMVVTGPVAKSIPTSLDVNTFSGGREARWRILRLASDGLTILAASEWSPLVSTVGIHTATLEFETIWREGELIAMQVESLDNGGTFSFNVEDADSFIDPTIAAAPTAPELLVEVYDSTPTLMGSETITDLSLIEAGVQKIIGVSDIAAPQTATVEITNTGRTLAVSRLLGREQSVIAPALVSATTDAAGTEIRLTFDRDMADPAGEHAAFSWREDAGAREFSAAALDGGDPAIIVLTVDGAAAQFGTTLDVSYAPGTVQSAEGVALEAFTQESVTNAVTDAPVLVSATTSTDGTEIRATFSKAMADPTGKHAEFSFDEDAVGRAFSAAALDGGDPSIIVLTVNGAAIAHTVPVTLSYTAGTVLAADGEVLASFTDEVVTNAVFTPPVVTNVFTSEDGTTVTYVHDHDMADPTGQHTAYSFREDAGATRGYTAAALGADPSEIVLTVDGAAIVAGTTVDGSYTPGTIQSSEGVALAGFTDEPIGNLVESNLTITTVLLPTAVQGEGYSQFIEVEGGTAPYSWDVLLGGFPTGLSLTLSTGEISGTVGGSAETSSVTLRVTDSTGAQAVREFTIEVVPATAPVAVGAVGPSSGIIDVDASVLSAGVTLPIFVPQADFGTDPLVLSVEAIPYSGWDGTDVQGYAGQSVIASDRRPRHETGQLFVAMEAMTWRDSGNASFPIRTNLVLRLGEAVKCLDFIQLSIHNGDEFVQLGGDFIPGTVNGTYGVTVNVGEGVLALDDQVAHRTWVIPITSIGGTWRSLDANGDLVTNPDGGLIGPGGFFSTFWVAPIDRPFADGKESLEAAQAGESREGETLKVDVQPAQTGVSWPVEASPSTWR